MKSDRKEKNNRLVSIVWGLVWLNFVTQYLFVASPLVALVAPTLFIASVYPLTTYLSTTLLTRAMTTKRWGRFIIQFLGISVVFGAVIFGLIFLFKYLETAGIFKESNFFSDMDSPLHEGVNIFLSALIVNFGFCGLRFLETNIRLQKELHESQLQTLNKQINPHSMFNILNHIHVLLQKDPQAADDLLLQYSSILRYQLYNGNKEQVSIKQEIDFLQQYIEVEKVRWKNKLMVTDTWYVENENLKISPLLFISFLENAFKHVARSDPEKGHIRISFRQAETCVEFCVANSKSRMQMAPLKESGLGLPNIRKRLGILYPGRHELRIDDTNDYYSVRLRLNL